MSTEAKTLKPSAAKRRAATKPGDTGWLRLRMLGRRWVHAFPAGDSRLVDALSAALGDGARPEPCGEPDGGLLVVALDGPGSERLLVRLRGDERTRLLPLGIAPSADVSPRAVCLSDAVLPTGPASMLQALLSMERLLERAEALPRAEGLSAVEARELDLVRYVHAHEVREMGPLPDPESPLGFRYPLAEALLCAPPADAVATLNELQALGLLDAEPCERVYTCESCRSSRLSFREVCPGCRLPALTEQPVIHHFRCAHVGPAADFRRDGRLVCPKCETALVHVGVDHDRPGTELRCSRCAAAWAEGIVECRCLSCDARGSVDAQRRIDLHSYRARPALARAAARTVPPLTSAGDLLRATLQPAEPGVYSLLRTRTEATCRRYNRPACVIRMAVENLDELTDRVGRPEVQRRVAGLTHALRPLVRNTDAVGLCDDVIEILLVETDLTGARVVAERIARALREQGAGALAVTVTVDALCKDAKP